MSNHEAPICTDCHRVAVEPVTLIADDGATRIVCKLHTLTDDELLASLGF